MAFYSFHFKLLTFCLFVFVLRTNCSKLNVPRVLLPIFHDFSTNYTLEVTEGGCYKWTSTRVDIVQITPIDEDPELHCSSRVVVSAITKEEVRNIAVVLAEDVNTGLVLRCDVIVDVIFTISVITKTRELFIAEAPELFEVRALDNQGNEFSTLDGVELSWTIVPTGPNKEANVLRLMPFSSYTYEAPSTILELEARDKHGYMVLLEGVNTGAAKVLISLPHSEYKSVPVHEVHIVIVANIILQPMEVYLMPGDFVEFKVYFLNSGKMEEIKLPDKQYYLDVENSNIAKIHQSTGEVSGMELGTTKLVLLDRNIHENDPPSRLPSATIHVLKPFYMVLNVLPHRNWAVIVGDRHDISVEVFTNTDHKMHLGGAVQVQIHFDDKFQVEATAPNGTWATGWCAKEGISHVEAVLLKITNPHYGSFDLTEPIQARGDLFIFPLVVISPPEVILPWDPSTRPKYDVDLVAKGGDGKFIWTSSDHSMGAVSQTGHVRTHGEGTFQVSASMMRNHWNRATTIFMIYPPSKLEIVDFMMEAEIGTAVHLHLALYAEKPGTNPDNPTYVPFTHCQKLPFQVKVSNDKFFQNKSDVVDPVGVSCGNIAMVARSEGTAKVTITYIYEGKPMEDSVTITAYKPVLLVQPDREVVLAVGSSANLVFTGGPRPPLGKPTELRRLIVVGNQTLVDAIDVTSKHSLMLEDFSVINVLCKKLGTTKVNLRITNSPVLPSCKSKAGTAAVKVICGKPRQLSLRPEIKVADAASCPMDITADRIVVQSKRDIELAVILQDDYGRKFINFSSLLIEWKSDKPTEFRSGKSTFTKDIFLGTVPIANVSYQSLLPAAKEGEIVTVIATVTGYNKELLQKKGITPEWPEFISEDERDHELQPIVATLGLILVEDTKVDPKTITIYNSPTKRETIKVTQGSGYYELALSANDLASVSYNDKTQEISLSPLKTGELTVQVVDLCLPSNPAIISVNIVSVGIIRLEMADKVEINKCIACTVRLYDENDNLLIIPDINVIELNHQLTNPVANIERVPFNNGEPWPPGEAHYIITGTELGDTKLTFSVSSGFEDVKSAPMDLQVFAPLRLSPKNGVVLIGSTIQLSTMGGPVPDADIEFDVSCSKFACISNKGVIKGLAIGEVKIGAKAVGVHPSTGKKVIYSEDTAEVKVIQLKDIKIAAPLTRFKVGSSVPCWVFGIPEQLSPWVIGSLDDPPVQFDWEVAHPDVATISTTFHPAGIIYQKPDLVAIKLNGISCGKTKLTLTVTVKGATANMPKKPSVKFTSSVNVEVIDPLTLLHPDGFDGQALLMAPFTSVQLVTNFDDSTKLIYSIQGQTSDTKNKRIDIAKVSSSGLVTSSGEMGQALIHIRSTDEYGLKQTLSIVIEVKNIHYMLLNMAANWKLHEESHLHTIPLGTEFELKATYYDNIGRRFDSGPSELMVRSSRCDLMKIKPGSANGSIWVATKEPGHTVIKAWAEGIQKTTDYIKLHVESVIRPHLEHVSRGDIICLSSPVLNLNGHKGKWLTSDKSLITIPDPSSGIGMVVGNKEGVVILTYNLQPSAPLHVQVLPVSFIKLNKDGCSKVLTNAVDGSVYSVSVVLHSDKSLGQKNTNLIAGYPCMDTVHDMIRTLPFKCHMAFANNSGLADKIFIITPAFSHEKGKYVCEIRTKSDASDLSQVNRLSTDLLVWATSSEEPDISSEQLAIQFVPNVQVPKSICGKPATSCQLNVKGRKDVLKNVKVNPQNEKVLHVGKASFKGDDVIFEIQILDFNWKALQSEDALILKVESPLTNQTMKVEVKLGDEPVGPGDGLGFMGRSKNMMVVIGSMLTIFLTTLYLYSKYLQPCVNVNVQPRSGPGGPCAANLSACQPSLGLSPRCATSPHIQRSPGAASTCANLTCATPPSREPVYGDISSFYNTSPDTRRNRRFM